jgi:DNA-binding response OmpR family regulator
MGRILVADDDAESRDLLAEVLEANGYEVETVSDGLAARESLARDGNCRVIIADLRMPNESGLDLLRHLGKQNAQYEIVLISSFFSATERKRANELGAAAVLDKPFRLTELLQVVSRLVDVIPSAMAVSRSEEKTPPNHEEQRWTQPRK